MKTIVIDPGHGGADFGAIGEVDGAEWTEATIVLAVSLTLASRLEAYDCTVILTRAKDKFLTLSERASIANRAGADAFLSIHANAYSKESANGFECFTSPGETRADLYATMTLAQWEKTFPGQTPRFDNSDGDPDKEARFAVLVATKAPAILFEMGFMTNPGELRFMRTASWQHRAARALERGLVEFLDLRDSDDGALTEPIEDPANVAPSVEQSLAEIRARLSSLENAVFPPA